MYRTSADIIDDLRDNIEDQCAGWRVPTEHAERITEFVTTNAERARVQYGNVYVEIPNTDQYAGTSVERANVKYLTEPDNRREYCVHDPIVPHGPLVVSMYEVIRDGGEKIENVFDLFRVIFDHGILSNEYLTEVETADARGQFDADAYNLLGIDPDEYTLRTDDGLFAYLFNHDTWDKGRRWEHDGWNVEFYIDLTDDDRAEIIRRWADPING